MFLSIIPGSNLNRWSHCCKQCTYQYMKPKIHDTYTSLEQQQNTENNLSNTQTMGSIFINVCPANSIPLNRVIKPYVHELY